MGRADPSSSEPVEVVDHEAKAALRDLAVAANDRLQIVVGAAPADVGRPTGGEDIPSPWGGADLFSTTNTDVRIPYRLKRLRAHVEGVPYGCDAERNVIGHERQLAEQRPAVKLD